jgi:hypothetical protein
MKVDYLSESIMYDAAANELHDFADRLRRESNAKADQYRAEGLEPPKYYDLLINDITNLRRKYLQESSKYFQRHKELETEFDQGGVDNLMLAISVSWAEDYEKALCNKDDKREKRLETLWSEARYIVTDRIVKRIEKAQREFREVAHSKLDEIISDTNAERERVTAFRQCRPDFTRPEMRNRCPCCGGGMYIAKKTNTNTIRVQCTNCFLYEDIKVVS